MAAFCWLGLWCACAGGASRGPLLLGCFGGSLFVSHLAFLGSEERLIASAQQLSAQLSSLPHLLLPAGSPGDPSFLRSLSLPPWGDASAGLNNFPSGASPVSLRREDAGLQQ